MRLLYVPLRREAIEAIADIARKERRRTQEQAAYLLEKAIQVDGTSKPHQREEKVRACE